MAGEFCDKKGHEYVMLVNLSLKSSTNIQIQTKKAYRSRLAVSAEDGRLSPLDEKHGYWLPAGHGLLIRFV